MPRPLFGPSLGPTAARDMAWLGEMYGAALPLLRIALRLSIYAGLALLAFELMRFLLNRLSNSMFRNAPVGWETYLDCGRPATVAIDTIGNCVGVLTRTPFLWFPQTGSFTSGSYRYSSWYRFKGLNTLTRYEEYETSIIYRKLLTQWNQLPDGQKFPSPFRPLPYHNPDLDVPPYEGWPTATPRQNPEAIPPLYPDPGTAPDNLPWRDLPKLRPRPRYRLRPYAPQEGNDPPGEGSNPYPGQPRPRPVPRPGVPPEPAPVPASPPGGKGTDKPGDKPHDRERKIRDYRATFGPLLGAVASYTRWAAEQGLEGIDLLEAFFKALPWKVRQEAKAAARRKGQKKVTAWDMARAVRDHFEDLDWMGHAYTDRSGAKKWSPGVVQNLIANQIEDYAYGKQGQAVKEMLDRIYKQTGFKKMYGAPFSGDSGRIIEYHRRALGYSS